jgi:ribosomal protein S18 acetylase RimI-like enzyme
MNIRTATIEDAHDIAVMHVQSWKESYKGIIHQEYLDQLSVEKREARFKEDLESRSKNNHEYFLALDDDNHIVGFASGGPNRKPEMNIKGELYAIYLLDKVKNQGIGKTLVLKVVNHLVSIDITDMLVWV